VSVNIEAISSRGNVMSAKSFNQSSDTFINPFFEQIQIYETTTL
jgi:hypothetical protein